MHINANMRNTQALNTVFDESAKEIMKVPNAIIFMKVPNAII